MPDTKTPEIKAIAKGIRISPRKVAVVSDLVRRRSVIDAVTILEHTERKAAAPLLKLINSAVANARHNLRMSAEEVQNLQIQTIMVTDGGGFKRYKFVGAGRRAKPRPMVKKSSHVTVILASPVGKKEVKQNEAAPAKKTVTKKTEPKAPVKKETKK